MVLKLSLAHMGNVVFGVTGSFDCKHWKAGLCQRPACMATTAEKIYTATDPGLELGGCGNLEQIGDGSISLCRTVGALGNLQVVCVVL